MPTLEQLAHVTLSPEAKKAQEEADRRLAEATAQHEAEIARTLGERPKTRLPKVHPGYAEVLDSVKLNLRIAAQHGTAMNSFDLWARTDFSALAKDGKQPTFDAFAGWLRNKAKEGALIYRPETHDEQVVRIGAEAVGSRYSRPANLYALASLTETVPVVTKRYDEFEPLSKEQAAWLAEHPAVRTKREKKAAPAAPAEPAAEAAPEKSQEDQERIARNLEAGRAAAEEAGREMAEAMQKHREAAPKADGRVAAGRRRRKDAGAVTVVQFEGSQLDQIQSELAKIKSENRQMRTAFYHMGMALASLAAAPENGEN